MRDEHNMDRPSLGSRFNAAADLFAQSLMAVAALAITLPPGDQALIGVLAGVATTKLWERFEAPAFVNRNHQPQTLYKLPWKDGVLVLQPRHYLNLRVGDEMVNHLYRLHGYFANQELADQYCQNASKVGGGKNLRQDEGSPMFREIIREAVSKASHKYADIDPVDYVARTPWSIQPHVDDPSQFVASREVVTSLGIRWVFYPPPPEGMTEVAALKKGLSEMKDPFLDSRQTDQSLDDMTNTMVTAWRAQAAPWTLVEVTPDSWTSAQVGQDGQVLQWNPTPPNTTSAHRVLESLRPLLPPRVPDPQPTENPELTTQWWAHVFNKKADGQRLGQVDWDDPLVAAVGLRPNGRAVWGVLAHPQHRDQVMAVRIQPLGDRVEFQGLLDPRQPGQLWAASPDMVDTTIRRVWAHERVVHNPPITVSVKAPAPSPLTPTLTPSVSSPSKRGISL